MNPSKRLNLLAACAAAATGCLDREPAALTTPSAEASRSVLSAAEARAGAPALERALAERIPTFGGIYIDGEGSIVILTTEPSPRSEVFLGAREVLGSFGANHPERRELLHRAVVHQEAQFAFDDLWRWRAMLESRVFVDGTAHSIGLSYERNQITVAVASDAHAASAARLAAEFEIPSSAIDVLVEEAPRPTDLNTAHPQLHGGMVIRAGPDGDSGPCTAGFPGLQGTTPVWLTAAHCSNQHPSIELGGPFTQKFLLGNSSFAGVVVATPPIDASTNPPTRQVDVALVQADSVTVPLQSIGFAQIARTTWLNTSGGAGSLTISGSDPTFNVVGEESSSPLQGHFVQKVGRTTGWNVGRVSDNCFTTAPTLPESSHVPYRYPCQVLVAGGSGWPGLHARPGDSGGPVFQNIDYGEVIASGILMAKTSSDLAIYSPMHAIRSALSLTADFVTDERVLRVFMSGPNYIDTAGSYSWEAEGFGGTGVYAYQWRVFRDSVGSWQTLGTSDTQVLSVDGTDGDMTLEVTVDDGVTTRTETLYVTNTIGCGGVIC